MFFAGRKQKPHPDADGRVFYDIHAGKARPKPACSRRDAEKPGQLDQDLVEGIEVVRWERSKFGESNQWRKEVAESGPLNVIGRYEIHIPECCDVVIDDEKQCLLRPFKAYLDRSWTMKSPIEVDERIMNTGLKKFVVLIEVARD
ncbi:hypothetical protein I7I51_00344, partial [Histoplasma capsulatum]